MPQLEPRAMDRLRAVGSIFVNRIEDRNEARLLALQWVLEHPDATLDGLYDSLKPTLHALWVRSPKELEELVLRRLSERALDVLDGAGEPRERDPETGVVPHIKGADRLRASEELRSIVRVGEPPSQAEELGATLRALSGRALRAEGRLSFCEGLLALLELELGHQSRSFHIPLRGLAPHLARLRSLERLADPDAGLERFREALRVESDARALAACAGAALYLARALELERGMRGEERARAAEDERALEALADACFAALETSLEASLPASSRTLAECASIGALAGYVELLGRRGAPEAAVESARQLLRRLVDRLILQVKGSTYYAMDSVAYGERPAAARAPYLVAAASLSLAGAVPSLVADDDLGRAEECARTVLRGLGELARLDLAGLAAATAEDANRERFGSGYGLVERPYPALAMALSAASGCLAGLGAERAAAAGELVEGLDALQATGLPLLMAARRADGTWDDRNRVETLAFTAAAARALALRARLVASREDSRLAALVGERPGAAT